VGVKVNMLMFLGEGVLCVVYFDEAPKRNVACGIAEELGVSKAIAMLVERDSTYVLMGTNDVARVVDFQV